MYNTYGLCFQRGLDDLNLTSIAQTSNARRHLADRSQRPVPSHKVGDYGDTSHFATSITGAPTEEHSIPPKLASTLEQIVGQLDMLTQVKENLQQQKTFESPF